MANITIHNINESFLIRKTSFKNIHKNFFIQFFFFFLIFFPFFVEQKISTIFGWTKTFKEKLIETDSNSWHKKRQVYNKIENFFRKMKLLDRFSTIQTIIYTDSVLKIWIISLTENKFSKLPNFISAIL